MKLQNYQGETLDCALHDAERSDLLVLLAHGVTGDKDREIMVTIADILSKNGWPTLRFSFSGNGESEGSFQQSTITKSSKDVSAILDYLETQSSYQTIIYVGYSMGAATGAMTAAKDKRINVLVSLAGMVNTKVFCQTEFGEVTPDQGCMWEDSSKPLSREYVEDLYNIDSTLPYASSIDQPWLLIHGDEDDVVLPQDSEQMHDALTGEKSHLVIPGTDHSFAGHHAHLAEAIIEWLEKHTETTLASS